MFYLQSEDHRFSLQFTDHQTTDSEFYKEPPTPPTDRKIKKPMLAQLLNRCWGTLPISDTKF